MGSSPRSAYDRAMARIGVLTASDKGAAGERVDTSGATIARMAAEAGHDVVRRAIVADDRGLLARQLAEWCDSGECDVVVTTGGTGLTTRDVTPEATRDIGEREVPGIAFALLQDGLQHTPFAALGRGIAVTRGRTLVVNLPGSPRGAAQGMEVLLPLIGHVVELLEGPAEHAAGGP